MREEVLVKYQTTERGERVEAIGHHSGYRIRISTLAAANLAMWPVSVHVRGSESEDEVRVDAPKRHLASAQEAIDYGYECAVLWIEAQDHRGY
jgi:hypothetical protein